MDAKRTSNSDEVIFYLSISEAQDVNLLVDRFTHWELIASKENSEPMMFMIQFGRDCRNAVQGFPTMKYSVERGQVLLSKDELMSLTAFLKACVEADGDQMTWVKRLTLRMAWKTLRNRLD
jgi:hypothetical protein